ncbi:acyltransferase family protein [Bosea sp. RAF48]|uniref:acyltransferase family protein n=1 Tax=Bosea sp. RAF48 TaxID=3237480 RepID=UPI003F8E9766
MKPRILELDGLRGIAALAVYFIHSGGFGLRGFGDLGNAIVDHGKFGVTLFFVVSAFCLCLSIATAVEGEPVDWRRFFIRRYFRIMPLFYAACAVTAVVKIWGGMPADYVAGVLTKHFSLITMVDPTTRNALIGIEWSVFVEFLFYFMFPFVLAWLIEAPLSMVAVTAVLMWPPVCKAITDNLGIVEPNFTIFWHFHSFLIGMLVFRLVWADAQRRPVLGSALFAVAVGLSVVAIDKHDHGFSVSAVSLAAACTIAAAHYGSPLVAWLRWRPLTLVGAVSFSIYLFHPLMMGVVGEFNALTPLQAVLALCLTLGVSSCTYLAIEVPAQQFARRMTLRHSPTPA